MPGATWLAASSVLCAPLDQRLHFDIWARAVIIHNGARGMWLGALVKKYSTTEA